MIRERILRIHVDDAALNFTNDAQIHEFQRALGRMVSYGMRSHSNEGIEFADLSIDSARTLVSAYHPAINWELGAQPYQVNKDLASIATALDLLRRESPVIVGAMLRGDGSYTYHS